MRGCGLRRRLGVLPVVAVVVVGGSRMGRHGRDVGRAAKGHTQRQASRWARLGLLQRR